MDKQPARKVRRRTSLNSSEIASPEGQELCRHLERITDDGKITESEAEALAVLVGRPDFDQFSSVQVLREVLRLARADGPLTEATLQQVYREIEKILPPDIRQAAKNRRMAATALEVSERRALIEQQKAAVRTARDQEQLIRMRSTAVATYDFLVAGAQHYDFNARMDIEGAEVFLAREPQNRYDRNAVQVLLDQGTLLGYLPREDASSAAPMLDRGYRYRGVVKRIYKGRTHASPVVWLEFFPPDTEASGTRTTLNPIVRMGKIRPARPRKDGADETKSAEGCSMMILVSLLALSVLVAAILLR